jgi:hypothetical protein
VSTEFYWLAVALVTVVSAARLTRLATVDKFPPVKWLRNKYGDLTDGSDWQWLMFCGYCFSFWATVFVVGWGWFSGVYDVSGNGTAFDIWWVSNGILAAAYLAAVFMAHDADPGDDD